MHEYKEETLDNLALSNLEKDHDNTAADGHTDEHEETHPADVLHEEEEKEIYPEHKEN